MNLQDIRNIIKRAIKLRLKQKIPVDESFCIFDLANDLGVEVRFEEIASLDGAYFKESKAILVSTLRPEGRIRFTCAHELGHFIFKHGDHFDELVEKASTGENKIEERMANIFAAFLLMPETTVKSFFVANDWDIANPSPTEIYIAASWLGVSYSSLVNHLHYSLKIIDNFQFKNLDKIQPKKIKSALCGFPVVSNLIVVNEHWKGRPIDMQVNDYLMMNRNIKIENDILSPIDSSTDFIFQATKPGLTIIKDDTGNNGMMVRIRRHEYFGRSIFRHLGED